MVCHMMRFALVYPICPRIGSTVLHIYPFQVICLLLRGSRLLPEWRVLRRLLGMIKHYTKIQTLEYTGVRQTKPRRYVTLVEDTIILEHFWLIVELHRPVINAELRKQSVMRDNPAAVAVERTILTVPTKRCRHPDRRGLPRCYWIG